MFYGEGREFLRESGVCSLSLRERVGVREATRAKLSLCGLALLRADIALAASLTPTLSRREREQEV